MSAASVEEVIERAGTGVVAVDFRRDRRDRPLITPPEGGKPVPYTRASAAGKVIDDTFNLEKWARRNVAFGMAHDASLVARLLAVGGTPQVWEKAEKDEVSAIVAAAEAVAGAHRAADTGSSVHKLSEHHDRGIEINAGPYKADLAAYTATLAEWGIVVDPDLIECRIVCDDLRMAGTADRLVRLTADSPLRRYLRIVGDEHLIADLKTGESVEYGALSWAVQLAAYARGELYDLARDVRLPTPPLNLRRGLIIHLPAGQGVCELLLVDLEAGYEAAVLSNEIRAKRTSARHWMEPARTAAPLPTAEHELEGALVDSTVDPATVTSAAVTLRARLQAAVAAGARDLRWPIGVPTFKEGGPRTWAEVLQVERTVIAAEAEVAMPFEHPSLPADPNVVEEVEELAPVVSIVDRQPALDPNDMDDLREAHHALPVDLQQAAFGAVIAAGLPTDRRQWKAAHREVLAEILASATAEHAQRKLLLASTLQAVDDELVGALVRAACPPLDDVDDPPIALEHLHGDHVAAVVAMAEAIESNLLGAQLDGGGVMEIIPVAATEAALLSAFDSKAAVVSAAREHAALVGRPKPRSAAAAAADPVLAALLLAGTSINQQGAHQP